VLFFSKQVYEKKKIISWCYGPRSKSPPKWRSISPKNHVTKILNSYRQRVDKYYIYYLGIY